MTIKIAFNNKIDGEPVFTGEINGQTFKVIRISTDIDYGWHPLDYLPNQDGGVAKEYWDDIEEYLWDNETTLLENAE